MIPVQNNGSMSKIHFGIDVVVPRILEIGLLRMPREACGIVVPDLDKPADDWVVELKNRSPWPESSYDIDPKIIRGIVKDPDAWADVLIWHTHPSGHVGPSKRDWDTMVQGAKYLVVAMPRGEASLYGK
jgi:proteasome lid subunit RPN8/RPN11